MIIIRQIHVYLHIFYSNYRQFAVYHIQYNALHNKLKCMQWTSRYIYFTRTAIYHDADRKCHYVVKSSHQNSIRIIIKPSRQTIKGPTEQNIFTLSTVLLMTLPFSTIDLSNYRLQLFIARTFILFVSLCIPQTTYNKRLFMTLVIASGF